MTTATWPASAQSDERVTAFMRSVYSWMFVGLALTGFVAFSVARSPSILSAVQSHQMIFWVLMLAQLGVVVVLSAGVNRLAPATAAALFLGYAALTGVTLAFLLLAYTGESVANAFLVAAGMFGAAAAYGTVSKRSLAGMGQFLFMGLIGIVLASIVGIFWQNDTLQVVISCVGVIVFTGLTAWDVQRLQSMALSVPPDRAGAYGVAGALSLYLNFINLFLSLLRLTGDRR